MEQVQQVEGIPPGATTTFERLLKTQRRETKALRSSVDTYLETIEEAALTRAHLDPALARSIAASCHALLDQLEQPNSSDMPSEQGRRQIVAAVEYFLLPRDGEDDLAYEAGLDDDAQVVSAVALHFGLTSLVVETPDRTSRV